MNSAEAKQILKDNFECKENSLIYLLHEKNMFSTEQFWKYYDSISVLAETDEEKSMNTAMQITKSYQDILNISFSILILMTDIRSQTFL